VIISDADLALVDPSTASRATPEWHESFPLLVIPGSGDIVDSFDCLEIDDLNAWHLWARAQQSAEATLESTTASATVLPESRDSSIGAVHPDQFRQALAHLPAPVTLVTCADPGGTPIGATVSAFSSLSLDPPLVVVSLDRRSGTLEAIRSRRAFAVHVLGDGHRPLAMRFAEQRGDKFHELDFERNDRGVPLLGQYSFRFECVLHDEFPGGDHVLVVGAVEELSEHDVSQDPVVWYGRGFQRLRGD
jgi:flavin reductase (DIM6/NTAB) family NADH-FMN oxidoreductase RutF